MDKAIGLRSSYKGGVTDEVRAELSRRRGKQ
jgi:hypothetical protein